MRDEGAAIAGEAWIGWCLAGCALLVLLLSVFFFSEQSLRLDEAQSLWQTSHTFTGMLKVIGEDVHVPLYHSVLHFWQIIFGNGVATARFLSLLFFLLVLPAMYLLGKALYGPREGVLGAFLVSISPFLNWYGNEIRMYSLFTLLSILSQYFFVRLFKDEESSGLWFGYAAVTVLGLYTHYFFGLVILAQILFFVSHRTIFPARAVGRFVAVGVIAALSFAPWIAWVTALGGAATERPLLATPTTANVFNSFSQFFFGFQGDHINSLILALWPLAVLLAFLSLQRGVVLSSETKYVLFSVLVPILAAFAASFVFQPIYLTRYLILAVPPLYFLLITMTASYPKFFSWLLRGAIVLLMMGALSAEIVSATIPVKENYEGVTSFLETHAKPQDVVVISAPFTIYPIEYYYRGSAALTTLPNWDRSKKGGIPGYSEADMPKEVKALSVGHEVAWVVLSYDQGYESELKSYFDNHYTRLYQGEFSPGLTVQAYRLRYDVPVEREGLGATTSTEEQK